MGGSQIALFAIFIIGVASMLLIFLYGSIVAYKGAKSKSSLGLLIGVILILLGLVFYSIGAIVFEYNNHDRASSLVFVNLALLCLTFGILLKSISFVVYVKQHNKFLKGRNH